MAVDVNKKALPSFNNISEGKSSHSEEGIDDSSEGEARTKARTYRIFEELSAAFERQVAKTGTTQTNLMNEILREYLSWAMYIINHESPFSTFDSATVRALMEAVDESKIEKIVNEVAIESATDFIKFRWNKMNFQNIVKYLDLISSYANVGSINVRIINGDNGNNGVKANHSTHNNSKKGANGSSTGVEECMVVVRHHLGKTFSKWMAIYISSLFTANLSRVSADYDISNKSAFVSLKMSPKNNNNGKEK